MISHSQVGLLDPRWVEERDKNITQKAREEVLLDIQIGLRILLLIMSVLYIICASLLIHGARKVRKASKNTLNIWHLVRKI